MQQIRARGNYAERVLFQQKPVDSILNEDFFGREAEQYRCQNVFLPKPYHDGKKMIDVVVAVSQKQNGFQGEQTYRVEFRQVANRSEAILFSSNAKKGILPGKPVPVFLRVLGISSLSKLPEKITGESPQDGFPGFLNHRKTLYANKGRHGVLR